MNMPQLKEFAIFKFVANLFGGKRKRKTASESPWLEDLDIRLATYDTNLMQPTTYGTTYGTSTASAEAEEQLRKLCNNVKEELNEQQDSIVVRKERRQVDATSVDMKAWWGGAVATWDPTIDSKNLDSINQQRRPRTSKWFDSQKGNDLGRPD